MTDTLLPAVRTCGPSTGLLTFEQLADEARRYTVASA